jgi:hypothetical protein
LLRWSNRDQGVGGRSGNLLLMATRRARDGGSRGSGAAVADGDRR